MEILILVLCLVLAIATLGLLLFGGAAVYRNYRTLQEALKEEQRAPIRVVSVKQEAGEVRIAYLTHPNGDGEAAL